MVEDYRKVCPFVDATQGVVVKEESINVNKISFGIIMLGTIKVTATMKFEGSSSEDL